VLFLFLEAYMSLIRFDLYNARGNFAGLHRVLHGHRPGSEEKAKAVVERVCSAVDLACLWYWKRALCLQRSFAVACLLKKRGIAAELVIGARQLPFKAHAWVEWDGLPVNDKAYMRDIYQILDRC
jgi:hypothetical protein